MRFFNKKSLLSAVGVVSIFFVLVLVAAIAMFVPNHRTARASSPFGGMVTSVYYCSCSNNYRLTVSPPVGGTFMYDSGTTVYEFYRIPVVGVWLLGLYGPPVPCIIPAGKFCVTIGYYPRIEMTGTSQ